MTINPKDLVPGCIVTVRATVVSIHRDGDVRLRFPCKSTSDGLGVDAAWCAPSEILSVEPRPFKVGDRVRHIRMPDSTHSIVAVGSNAAWVVPDGTQHMGYVVKLSNLTHEGDAS